jgi:hypothetical protein
MNQTDYVTYLQNGGPQGPSNPGTWKGRALVSYPTGKGTFEVTVLLGKPKRGRTFAQISIDAGLAVSGQHKARANNGDLTESLAYSTPEAVPSVDVPVGVAAALVAAARPEAVDPASALGLALAFFARLPHTPLEPLPVSAPVTAGARAPSGGAFGYWFFDAFDLDQVGVLLPETPPDAAWVGETGPKIFAEAGLHERTSLALAMAQRVAGWHKDVALAETLGGFLAQHQAQPDQSLMMRAMWIRSVAYCAGRFGPEMARGPGRPERLGVLSTEHVGRMGPPEPVDLLAIHLAEAATSAVGDGPALRKAALRLGRTIARELRHEAERGELEAVMPDVRDDMAGGDFGNVIPTMIEVMGQFSLSICSTCPARCLDGEPDAARFVRNGVHPLRISPPVAARPKAPDDAPRGRSIRRKTRRR